MITFNYVTETNKLKLNIAQTLTLLKALHKRKGYQAILLEKENHKYYDIQFLEEYTRIFKRVGDITDILIPNTDNIYEEYLATFTNIEEERAFEVIPLIYPYTSYTVKLADIEEVQTGRIYGTGRGNLEDPEVALNKITRLFRNHIISDIQLSHVIYQTYPTCRITCATQITDLKTASKVLERSIDRTQETEIEFIKKAWIKFNNTIFGRGYDYNQEDFEDTYSATFFENYSKEVILNEDRH